MAAIQLVWACGITAYRKTQLEVFICYVCLCWCKIHYLEL